MLMLAAETARTTREFDLDKEEKLAKAEKYAKDGMALIPGAQQTESAGHRRAVGSGEEGRYGARA